MARCSECQMVLYSCSVAGVNQMSRLHQTPCNCRFVHRTTIMPNHVWGIYWNKRNRSQNPGPTHSFWRFVLPTHNCLQSHVNCCRQCEKKENSITRENKWIKMNELKTNTTLPQLVIDFLFKHSGGVVTFYQRAHDYWFLITWLYWVEVY